MPPSRPRPRLATNDIAPPDSAAELVERVRAARASLESAIAGLSEAQLTQLGPQGWSVKDHLAHIAAWERGLTAVLRRRPQAEGFDLTQEEFAKLKLDQLNDVLFRRDNAVSLDVALNEARRAHAQLMEALERLRDDDLQKTIAEYGGPSTDQRPLLVRIAQDSYAHYAEHQVWIGELLSALR
jgi:Protein of unknown function (DUF1706)